MSQRIVMALALLGVGLLVGCGTVGEAVVNTLVGSTRTTVRLVNSTDFPLTVEFRYSDDQLVLPFVLRDSGTRVERVIAANSEASYSDDCDALQAVVITAADLDIAIGLGPGTDSRVYRDGTDFGCGDTLIFTFESDGILDLTVDFDTD